MSDNWDDEDNEPVGFDAVNKASNKWEGEDDEDDVKESWEELEDEGKEKSSETKPSTDANKSAVNNKVKKKKLLSEKIAAKDAKPKAKDDDDYVDDPEAAAVALTPEEIYEQKLIRQRLQEDADLELAKDTFGVKNETLGLEGMNPTTKADFDSFRNALVETVAKHEKSSLYFTFLDELFRDLCLNLEAEDVKKLGNTVQSLGNEKHKIKMAKQKKKSKGKASLVVGRANDYVFDDDYATNEYEDFM